MTRERKHIDEERCKICKGVYPDESDQIDGVYLYDPDYRTEQFIGYFCEFCRPPSAYVHPKLRIYMVDRTG